jgi:hypothetical protein
MRLGSVTSAPAARGTTRVAQLSAVTPVQRITPDWVEEDPLDELTQSDRALLGHLYGDRLDLDALEGTPVGQLASAINRERHAGAVSGGRDLTAEDLRRILGRLTLTAPRSVPLEVQVRLMTVLKGDAGASAGRLDVVL